MNADGVIFNNVYDNGYSNNQVIFSFRDNLKNGRLFKKGSRQLTTPANQDITPTMWEYARRNYVKDTGINNNMTEWLNSVDERDIIAFTKWLSKHSPAIAAPLIGGTLYDDKW